MGKKYKPYSPEIRIAHGCSKHGMARTPFYRVWMNMKVRCFDSKCKAFPNYGGRGIRVCDRWLDFNNFKEDMYQPYLDHVQRHGFKDTSIDRINNDGNYEPSNCKWATRKEQVNNRRLDTEALKKQAAQMLRNKNKVFYFYHGKQVYLNDLAKEHGLHPAVLRKRIVVLGWSMEEALSEDSNKNRGYKQKRARGKKVIFEGEEIRIIDLEKKLGLRPGIIHERLSYGWSIEKALTHEKRPRKAE